LIGYARTSTLDQTAGFEAQLDELSQAGCEKVFSEQVSSVAPRGQLEAALEFVREGDVLVVCKLDRLARSTQHLLDIVDQVKRKGAHLQILNLGMDTSTATGKLLLTMIGAIGQFEREMMLERQREGKACRCLSLRRLPKPSRSRTTIPKACSASVLASVTDVSLALWMEVGAD
jgi:DNA invertase Pin-like site-specific DNA recombinase